MSGHVEESCNDVDTRGGDGRGGRETSAAHTCQQNQITRGGSRVVFSIENLRKIKTVRHLLVPHLKQNNHM